MKYIDLFETFSSIFAVLSNNWIILVIIAIIITIVITFNEIQITSRKWNYQSNTDLEIQDSHHPAPKTIYPDYSFWYSSFNNDPFNIIINIHDKFIECLEAEYPVKNTRIRRRLANNANNANISHYASQISDPELKSFVLDPSHWLKQRISGKKIHFYEKDRDPDLIKIELAELVPIFHDIITRILTYLKQPLDKDWVNFYGLVDKRKLLYRNKILKILFSLILVDIFIIGLFYFSISLFSNQLVSIFIIIFPMFFLALLQPLMWKYIRYKFFETTNILFSTIHQEGS